MLVCEIVRDKAHALRTVREIHKLREPLSEATTTMERIYRPFYLLKAPLSGQDRSQRPVNGCMLLITDARVPRVGVLGAFPFVPEDTHSLTAYGFPFHLTEHTPEADSVILEGIRTPEEITQWLSPKLMLWAKKTRKTLKLNRIAFDAANVQYELFYRAYWRVEFRRGRDKEDREALVCSDEIAINKNN